MTGKRILCIILICMGTLSLSGCNSIYQALSDGTEKILDMASDIRTFQKRNICLAVLMLKESREMN